MFSYENSYDFVGLGAEESGLQGHVQCFQGWRAQWIRIKSM